MAPDGKMRKTDVATAEQLLRLVQSIPNKKAEPFKLCLARIGSERLDEIADPELAINRALETYAHVSSNAARRTANNVASMITG